jgi:hypothetical protein
LCTCALCPSELLCLLGLDSKENLEIIEKLCAPIKQVTKLVMPPLIMEDLKLALSEIRNNIDNAYFKKLVKWGGGGLDSDMKD